MGSKSPHRTWGDSARAWSFNGGGKWGECLKGKSVAFVPATTVVYAFVHVRFLAVNGGMFGLPGNF